MEQQVIIFNLGNESFGVDIAAVDSIIKMQEITRVPQALDFVVGITNLREAVLPVIDLRKRLGMVSLDNTHDTRIIVINLGGIKTGMIVDAVTEVATIDEVTIEPPPSIVSAVDTAYITGIVKLEDRLIILLDFEKVMHFKEIETSLERV